MQWKQLRSEQKLYLYSSILDNFCGWKRFTPKKSSIIPTLNLGTNMSLLHERISLFSNKPSHAEEKLYKPTA